MHVHGMVGTVQTAAREYSEQEELYTCIQCTCTIRIAQCTCTCTCTLYILYTISLTPMHWLQVLCAAAVNPATFLSDHSRAITVAKFVTPPPEGEKGRPPVTVGVEGEGSMSLIWIITGVPNLTKVGGRVGGRGMKGGMKGGGGGEGRRQDGRRG